MKHFNFYFDIINEFYGTQSAKRSEVPYIAHILEGLNVLQAIGASEEAQFAYTLHPIFQDDTAVVNLKKYAHAVEPYVLGLCMEYRKTANAYLSKRKINDISEIELSPLKDVNDMLIADKVQNCKDFELYQENHPRNAELKQYFENWHTRLGINYQDLKKVCFNVAVTCIVKHNGKYLLLNRYNHDRTMIGQCNVGGKLENGEKILEGLFREMREEIGFCPSTVPQYYDAFYAVTKRGPVAVLTYFVEITDIRPQVTLNCDEFEGYEWVDEKTFQTFWNNDVLVDEEKDNFIGVDFDGTVIGGGDYPHIGKPLPHSIETLKELVQNGYKIIPWTMRWDHHIPQIKDFFKQHGVEIYAVNCHKTQWKWTSSPKLYADYFIDDRNIGTKLIDGNIDWLWMREELKKLGMLK